MQPTSTKMKQVDVIIPSLNAANTVAATLDCLSSARKSGFIAEVFLCDGGSLDHTAKIAEAADVKIINSEAGRGLQLSLGGSSGSASWLLFLHADTRLNERWEEVATEFINNYTENIAAAFSFKLDDDCRSARVLEWLVNWRCQLLGLPYGDQGLLISRKLYEGLGGYRSIPLMEDIDLVRRIGKARLVILSACANTSATKYQREGYLKRSLKNLCYLILYLMGVPTSLLARRYT